MKHRRLLGQPEGGTTLQDAVSRLLFESQRRFLRVCKTGAVTTTDEVKVSLALRSALEAAFPEESARHSEAINHPDHADIMKRFGDSGRR